MRYFRHPPLLFWSLAVVVLVGVVITAAIIGESGTPRCELGVPNQDNVVFTLRNHMAELPELSSNQPAKLVVWAESCSSAARDDAETYVLDGGLAGAALEKGYQGLAHDCTVLAAAVRVKSMAMGVDTEQVESDGDNLVADVAPITGVLVPAVAGCQPYPLKY